ncbi:tetratricopeptide repeat protein [Sphingorhabdus sp. M41]|uniref:tetratricopeptide repeat protein n=1 Tax=Sphingorhabdus sp. M41 TaxID=1806885 RepID=UPI00078C495C|nr:hypothetical protein [Sphingorhabdus sp. M41]AMO71038.1 hypothetical protein AZE99_03450 [Sphingorhabdus sp. M41]
MTSSPISEERRAKLLRAETHMLLQSPDFIRSPVMSQLLSYLVEEAISNPANPPKAYQVAVDGLGRTEDFDVQADSYPRVQVGRLRKMLSAHYAAHHSATRLHIPIGHYAVEIEVNDAELEELPIATTSDDVDLNIPAPTETKLDLWFKNRWITFGIAALLIIAGADLIWLLNTSNPNSSGTELNSDRYTMAPKIYVAVTRQDSGVSTSGRASGIQHFFEDAFARSAQVRLAAANGSDINSDQDQNAYLFKSQIVEGAAGPEINFSLTSLIEKETIWSTTLVLPDSMSEYPEKLGPVASRIASIYGVIATDQRKHLPDGAMIGYSCLLRFENYRANRDPDLLPVVESCIKKSLEADPLDSQILAAASFMSFLRVESSGKEPDFEAGLQYARRAMVRGREDASANFALARSSFFNRSCARGKEFAEKAVELDPYEATIQAQTGGFLFGCGDPDANKYLRRAIALDPSGSIVAETGLVLTLLSEGKDKEALEIAEKIVPSSTGVGPYYDIAMAMVYAKNGRIEDSRESWDKLVAAYGSENESQEQLIKRLIINPGLANRAFMLLSISGVISE